MKEVLLQLKELMGDSFDQLLNVYTSDTRKRLDDIRICIDEGDGEGVKKLAHAIKGSSRNMGAEDLATVCEQCELLSRENDRAILEELHKKACVIFDNICEVIEMSRSDD